MSHFVSIFTTPTASTAKKPQEVTQIQTIIISSSAVKISNK
jgi:hypothetical protein